MKQLSFLLCLFSGFLLFMAGYISGIGQNLSCGHSIVKEVRNVK